MLVLLAIVVAAAWTVTSEQSAAWCLLVLLGGCATASPEPISDRQERLFRDTVRAAERANPLGENARAEAALRSAKSDFYYAEHSPMNPERARLMAAQAQAEADTAVALSRGREPSQASR